MAFYLYQKNRDYFDRTSQIEFQRDDGSTVVVAMGGIYDLTANEVVKLSRYIVLVGASGPGAEPQSISHLPIIGTPTDGQVPIFDSSLGAFVPGSAPGSGIPPTLLDAKGDLIVATANDTASRLAIGTDGMVLQADSSRTAGVKWASIPSPTIFSISVKDSPYLAKGDTRQTSDGSVSGSTLTSATMAFTAADVGKTVMIVGAGTAVTPTGTTALNSNQINGVSSMTGIAPGAAITGAGIQAGTTIVSWTGTTIEISKEATAAGTVTLTIAGLFVTTIQTYTNATTVQLSSSATTPITSAIVYVGTDDTAAIQAAVNAALATPNFSTVNFPAGFYLITGTIACNSGTNYVNIQGEGRSLARFVRSSGIKVFEWTLAGGSNVNLAADVAPGDTILSFNTTGVKAGDYLTLRHTRNTGSTSGSNEGEMVQVKAVLSSTRVQLWSGVIGRYYVANTARVAAAPMMQSPMLSGVGFTSPMALTTNEQIGYVNFRQCDAPIISDIAWERADQYGLQFDCSVHEVISDAYMRDMYYVSSLYLGYGILMRGPSQWLTAVGIESRNSQVFNNGGTLEGFPRFAYVQATASQGDPGLGEQKGAVATHSDGEYFTFDLEINSWTDIAVYIKGNYHTIRARTNNVLGAGIHLVDDAPQFTLTGVTSSGSTFTKTAHGLQIGDVVDLTQINGGTGLFPATAYFVVSTPTANTFTLATSKGGTAITPSTAVTSMSVSKQIIPRDCTVILERGDTIPKFPSNAVNGVGVLAQGIGHTIIVEDCRHTDGYVVRCNSATGDQTRVTGGHTIIVENAEDWGRVSTNQTVVGLGPYTRDCDILRVNGKNAPGKQVISFSTTTISGVTSTGSPDTFTANSHGLQNNQPVRFSSLTGGTGIIQNQTYYVINAATNTFQLASAQNGSAIDASSDLTAGTLVACDHGSSSIRTWPTVRNVGTVMTSQESWALAPEAQPAAQSVNYAATITPDPMLGKNIVVSPLTGAITFNPPIPWEFGQGSFPKAGVEMTLHLTEDATGGRAITISSTGYKKNFTPTTTANAKNTIAFASDGTNMNQVAGVAGIA